MIRCKNCSKPLEDEQNYCFDCGAKVIRNRLTARNLSSDFSEQFLSYDNKFLKTFIDLFKKPEEVINKYINGTRKRYSGVIQYFAISLSLVGLQLLITNSFFIEEIAQDLKFLDDLQSVPKDDKMAAFQESLNRFNAELFNNYQNLIYLFSVPLGALSTWLGYRLLNYKQFNFVEHLVINLYYSAQIIIVTTVVNIIFLILGLNFVVIASLIFLASFAYFFYVFKRVFNLSFWDNLPPMLLIFIFYSLLFVLFMFVIGVLYAIKFFSEYGV